VHPMGLLRHQFAWHSRTGRVLWSRVRADGGDVRSIVHEEVRLRGIIMSRCLTAFGVAVCLIAGIAFLAEARSDEKKDTGAPETKELLAELKTYPHKLVYETNRDGNWELYLCNADGSDPRNLTNTKDVDELYPKPSPDGTKICFVADEGKGDAKIRNIYYM